MGLFDYVRCKFPLPVAGANDLEFQTKDTDWPYMERYEIREDGTLWRERYDIEDRSDPKATGLAALVGCMTRVNERWEPEPLTGSLNFYHYEGDREIAFDALFKEGMMVAIVDQSAPSPAAETEP